MGEKESLRAGYEARREMESAERSAKHEDEVRRYLGGAFYLAEKRHHEEEKPHEQEKS